jgi:hypothetical protein
MGVFLSEYKPAATTIVAAISTKNRLLIDHRINATIIIFS